jgi:catechol 2,3-dioxygenase-like lactoylglutathione lyase family enzyme
VMVALPVESRAKVEEAYALVLGLGASDEGAPGIRTDNVSSFYSCYFRDPSGNKLCVCCFD